MMFLFAGHSAGLLSKNFVKQSFTKFLESQLHGSRRKSYLSAPFFFHLRYGTHGYGMSAYEITAKFSQLQVI